MLHTLLIILKIIGIVLLILLTVLIVAILAVLFVPVRYQGNLEKHVATNIEGTFRFSWLLFFLRGQFDVAKKRLIIKILCFTLYDSGKTNHPKEEYKEKENKGSEMKESVKPNHEAENSNTENQENPDIQNSNQKTDDNASDKSGAKLQTNKLKKLGSIKYTLKKLCDKIKEIVDNISYYLEILKSDEFLATKKLLTTQVFYLIKHLKPRSIEGYLNFGFDDPTYTGYGMAVYGMFYPFWGNAIRVEPDFDNEILELKIRFKGRARVVHFAHVARKIFFSKEGRIVFRKLRK